MILSSTSNNNVEAWIRKWESLYGQAKAAKIPDVSCRNKAAILDFLVAVQKLDSKGEYFSLQWQYMIAQEEYSFWVLWGAYGDCHLARVYYVRSNA